MRPGGNVLAERANYTSFSHILFAVRRWLVPRRGGSTGGSGLFRARPDSLLFCGGKLALIVSMCLHFVFLDFVSQDVEKGLNEKL